MTEAPAPSAPTDGARLSRRGVERLDLLLLTIEALDLNGGEAMVWTSQQMGLQAQFPNRVELWKRRCHNPLRRTTRRDQLNPVDAESLICLVCAMADRLYPMLHQLLSSREPEQLTQQRWQLFHERLRDLIEERMNQRREAVVRLLTMKSAGPVHRQLISTLAFCAGPGGNRSTPRNPARPHALGRHVENDIPIRTDISTAGGGRLSRPFRRAVQ